MWMKFKSKKPYAVQLFVGGVNAVSGQPLVQPGAPASSTTRESRTQDYMVIPEQKWIDGIATRPGEVRQFIAMPTGSGYSVEVQVTGREDFAGMLFAVTPRLSPSTSVGFHQRARDQQIRVDRLGHRPFHIAVNFQDTIDDLKHLIHRQMNIAPLQHELIYHNHQLDGKYSQGYERFHRLTCLLPRISNIRKLRHRRGQFENPFQRNMRLLMSLERRSEPYTQPSWRHADQCQNSYREAHYARGPKLRHNRQHQRLHSR